MSGPPKVQLADGGKPVSVRDIAIEGSNRGVIHAGMTRDEIHRRLAGLPMHRIAPSGGLTEQEQFGPFEKEILHLYIASYETPSHQWGFHRVPCTFFVCVNYDEQGVAQTCFCSEAWSP